MLSQSEKLKHLQTQRDKLVVALADLKQQMSGVSREMTQKQAQFKEIEDQIEKLHHSEVIISEHAIVRYFERVLGFDLGEIRGHILTSRLKTQIELLGNGTFPVDENGVRAKVANNVIVTIV